MNNSESISPNIASLYLPRTLIVIGPAIGALITTYLQKGRQGLNQLVNNLRPERKHIIWYFIAPLVCFIITSIAYLSGGLSLARISELIVNHWYILVFHFFLQSFLIGIGEEIGWRGWLLPKLTSRYTFIKSILLTILIWGLWHFPIFFYGLEIVIPWLLVLVSSSIILSWVWIKTQRNIFIIAIIHGSINTPHFFFENQLLADQSELILNGWKINGYLYAVIGLYFLFRMKSLLLKKTVNNENL